MEGSQRSKTVIVKHQKHGGKGEAEAALEAFKVEVRTHAPTKSEWTLRTLVEDYATSRERIGKARSTVDSYRFVGRRLTDDFGSKPLDEITPDDVDAFYGDLAGRDLKRPPSATLTPSSSPAMNFAVEKKRVSENVILRATPPDKVRSTKRRIEPGEADLMIRLAAAPVERTFALDGGTLGPRRKRRGVGHGYLLGDLLRRQAGELCGLRWDDFDPHAGTLHFERNRCRGRWAVLGQSKCGYRQYRRSANCLPGAAHGGRPWRMAYPAGRPYADGWIVSHDGDTPMRAKALGEAITPPRQEARDTGDHALVPPNQLDADGGRGDRRGHGSPEVGAHTRGDVTHYVQGADDKAVEAAVALEDRLVGQGMAIEGYLAAAQ